MTPYVPQTGPATFTLGFEKAKVYEGAAFVADSYAGGLAAGGTSNIHMYTGPNTTVLRKFTVHNELGIANAHIYENTVLSSNGTSVAGVCLNRQSNAASQARLFRAATVSTVGNTVFGYTHVGGTTNADNMLENAYDEIILRSNAVYTFGISKVGPTANARIHLEWYELKT